MSEETEIRVKDQEGAGGMAAWKGHEARESKAFGVSVRAWICLLIVLTICAMSALETKVTEPLYSLGFLVVGYYFGQGNKPKTQQQP